MCCKCTSLHCSNVYSAHAFVIITKPHLKNRQKYMIPCVANVSLFIVVTFTRFMRLFFYQTPFEKQAEIHDTVCCKCTSLHCSNVFSVLAFVIITKLHLENKQIHDTMCCKCTSFHCSNVFSVLAFVITTKHRLKNRQKYMILCVASVPLFIIVTFSRFLPSYYNQTPIRKKKQAEIHDTMCCKCTTLHWSNVFSVLAFVIITKLPLEKQAEKHDNLCSKCTSLHCSYVFGSCLCYYSKTPFEKQAEIHETTCMCCKCPSLRFNNVSSVLAFVIITKPH